MSDRRLLAWTRDLLRFGAVGGLGLVVDVGLFNLLRASVLAGHAVPGAPLIAKTLSLLAAIAVNWAGNRWWAFRDRRNESVGREAVAFVAVSLGGSVIALLCLAFSHYVLGLTTLTADNVSANVIGLALGSAFRFVALRLWVFRGPSRLQPRIA